MKKLLKYYTNPWDSKINENLINKSDDKPLVDYVKDSLRSIEDIVKPIKITKFEYTEKESEIDANNIIFRRQKKTKKKDMYDIKNIEDDRCGRLTIYIDITITETDPKTKEKTVKVYPIKKSILIPIEDENGFYTIKGKKYYMIYQLLEKSTYTSSNSITLKSLMPITLKRQVNDVIDMEGDKYELPVYTVTVFRKDILAILFYVSRGMRWALDFFGLSHVITFDETHDDDTAEPDKYVYFKISSKLYIKCLKSLFIKHNFIQSVVGGILSASSNRMTKENIETPEVWVKKIVSPPSVEKGFNIIKSFDRLLDETTKKILKVPDIYKTDIYALILWMMQHFNELRLKDNCDLSNKRLRCNEYIASLLTKEFSKRLNRILALGDNATIDNIKEIFKFSGDILINKLHSSGILRFDDNVNDMNFWTKLKYTSKGPNSLGGVNGNNIPIKYRDLHPSMMGEIDILVCGNSDPGTSGLLSPFSSIKSMYFNDEEEISSFLYDLNNELTKIAEDSNTEYVTIKCDNQTDYYNILYKLRHVVSDTTTVYGTSKAGTFDIMLEKEHDMDDKQQHSTVLLRKKTSDK